MQRYTKCCVSIQNTVKVVRKQKGKVLNFKTAFLYLENFSVVAEHKDHQEILFVP